MNLQRNEDGTWYVDPKTGMMTPLLVPHIETWRVFESYYKTGKLRSLGLSNFSKEQIKDLYYKAEIKPHNLQVSLVQFKSRSTESFRLNFTPSCSRRNSSISAKAWESPLPLTVRSAVADASNSTNCSVQEAMHSLKATF